MNVDLHICIVSYNTRELLDGCLRSLATHRSKATFGVTVVDNGSTDGSVEMAREKYPQVRVVEETSNSGYGRANNIGLLRTPARYYLALNSDTVVMDGAVDALVDGMDAAPEIGAAGGALLNPDGSMQKSWAVGELTLASVLWEQTFLAKIFSRSRRFGDYFRVFWERDGDALVPQACGACLIVRADLFNSLNGFDPAIFMYAEDTELCLRIRSRGYQVAYFARARFVHLHGQSSAGELRPRMIAEHNISRMYFFAKRSGRPAAAAARAIMTFGALARAALRAAAGKPASLSEASCFLTVACLTALARIPAPPPPEDEP